MKITSNEVIHFVGIGGIGMSGLAQIMHNMGFMVQGSDLCQSKNTDRLRKFGIKIFIGHKKKNIKKVTMLVISSAIKKNNVEYLLAKKKKIPLKKIIDMKLKKTGRLFCFCCVVPVIIAKKNIKIIKKFEAIGSDIGLLFQIADDLIDYKGDSIKAGKKTNKDKKQGKANLISLLGYNNAVIYGKNLKLKIQKKLKNYGKKSNNLSETLEYFLYRNK